MTCTLVHTPTLEEFQQFAKDCAPAARAVLRARVHAQMERERVDAYVLPIFQAYTFHVKAEWADRLGMERITKPGDLYLSDDDTLTAAFYAECDAAHRAHGFTGPDGYCPALAAETLLMETERAFLKLAEPLLGIAEDRVYGDNRKKYLELLIGACALDMTR